MKQYLQLLLHVLDHGVDKADRTGTGTRSIFGYQMRFDLTAGFPLITTKRLHLRSIIYELLWFLRGETNTRFLNRHNVSIWDEWATADGDLGPIYGKQWRCWPGENGETVDQIKQLIQELRRDPDSRRLLVSAWNPAVLPDVRYSPSENAAQGRQALPPCHTLFQFYVAEGRLSCQLYQRSADIFLGLPFNIASYALLTTMVAQVCELEVGEFVHTLGDAHLYKNHIEQAKIQLSRSTYDLPVLQINPEVDDIFAFKYEDFSILNYQAHPHIKAEVAV